VEASMGEDLHRHIKDLLAAGRSGKTKAHNG